MQKFSLKSPATALTLSLILFGSSINVASAQANQRIDVQKLAVEVHKRVFTRAEAQQLQQYIETHPGDIGARKIMGQVYESYGFYILALEEYRIASSIAKNDAEALLLAANLQNGLNVLDADKVAEQAVKFMGNDLSALVQVGVFLDNLGKTKQADRVYERAKQVNANSPEFSCIQAYTLLSHRQFAECIIEADKAMKAEKLKCLALLAKGQALTALNKPQQALECFSQARRLQPMDDQVNEHYFRALVARGKNSEAIEPGLLALAMTYRERNHRLQRDLIRVVKHVSPEALQKAIAEASSKLAVTAFQAKFHFALGDLFDKLQRPDLAMKEYRRGLQINPVFSPAYARLAKDLGEYDRDYDQALQNYALAIRLDPADDELYFRALRMKAIRQNKSDSSMQLKDWWRRNVRQHAAVGQ